MLPRRSIDGVIDAAEEDVQGGCWCRGEGGVCAFVCCFVCAVVRAGHNS